LVFQLAEPIVGEFTFQIGAYNANQSDLGDMTWGVYDVDGALIASGTFADLGGVANNNGTYTGDAVMFDDPVSYIVFGMDDNTGSGYSVTDIAYTDTSYPTGLEDFIYTVEDNDGDSSSSHLYITSDEHIEGDGGANTLTGGFGDDILQGFDGSDTLIGAGGLDILVGGEGEDAFVFSANAGEGNDTIVDFNSTEDTLSFSDLLDGGDLGLEDDLAAYADTIGVEVVGDDLVLTIPEQGGGANETTVTLAGLGDEYAAYDGGTLGDMIDNAVINADTYSS
jgi:Ca2+-binding RTX toxin-like protein